MALLMPTESSSSRDKPSKSPWGVQGPVTTEPLNASLLRIGFEEPLPMGWAGIRGTQLSNKNGCGDT
jgi:hypothetical protein